MNFSEMNQKASAIIQAYESAHDLLESNPDNQAAVEVPIDEAYVLIGIRGGATYIIMSVDGSEQLDFIPDDDWEPGDIVGAYLNLYFGEE